MFATMDATIDALAQWLQAAFPGSKIEHGWVRDDSYLLLRVHRTDGKCSEIQFAEIALEDYAAEDILRDLARANAVRELRKRTSHRFTYGPSREITPIERMVVRCDGRRYTVIRNLERAVSVIDEGGHALKVPRAVLSSSIFHRLPSQWIEDIRRWR